MILATSTTETRGERRREVLLEGRSSTSIGVINSISLYTLSGAARAVRDDRGAESLEDVLEEVDDDREPSVDDELQEEGVDDELQEAIADEGDRGDCYP